MDGGSINLSPALTIIHPGSYRDSPWLLWLFSPALNCDKSRAKDRTPPNSIQSVQITFSLIEARY